MKKVGMFLVALAITSSALAGSKILSCVNGDGTDSVDLYQNENGTVVAVVTQESFGGSAPQFKYLVGVSPLSPGGSRVILDSNKKFALSLQVNHKDFLSVPEIRINEPVSCK